MTTLDPYDFADHRVAMVIAMNVHQMMNEMVPLTVKHGELWRQFITAQSAVKDLWEAIDDHSVHCKSCG